VQPLVSFAPLVHWLWAHEPGGTEAVHTLFVQV